jgi:hypothetical protein
MFRTLILAGLLYGHYATGHIWYLYGAIAALHVVQENIISVIKAGTTGGLRAIQQLRGVQHESRDTETETD